MTTMTKERAQEIFLGNGPEPTASEERELARIALASLTAEPIGAFHIADQQVDGTSDYIKDGEWPIDNGVIEVYAAPPASEREQIRREHAEWSDKTFGGVGPVGPLKHLSKEALEAAANPSDPLEWADMQFLLWDAQRRMGISDEFITRAMIEKLAINKARQWPEPKDGEPRLHIKEKPALAVTDSENGLMPCPFCGGKAHQLTIEQDDDPHFGGDVITCTECGASSHVEFGFKENLKSAWNSRAAMLHAGNDSINGKALTNCDTVANSPVITDGWMAEAERLAQLHGVSFVIFRQGEIPVCADPTKFWFGYDLAAPRPEVKKRTNAEKATMGARLTNHRFKI